MFVTLAELRERDRAVRGGDVRAVPRSINRAGKRFEVLVLDAKLPAVAMTSEMLSVEAATSVTSA
jgi:hypothetical protein